MLNDFIPVIHKLSVEEHPNGITIIPLADAHYGSPEFNSVRWHKAIKRIYDDPHCFFVIVGDLLNNATRSSISNIFLETASPRQQKEWLIEELRCVADKCLGCVEGNHERRTSRETDQYPLYDVMFALGKDDVYRPSVCFMQVRFVKESTGIQRNEFSFAITHGAGGGMYVGSSANRVQNFGLSLEGCDCIITGHTHKPLTFPVSKLVFNGNAKTVKQKQFSVVVASSFLDYGGYPVEKLLPPTANTLTEIVLTYRHDGTGKELRVLQ